MQNIQPVQDPADCLVEFLLDVPCIAGRVSLLFGSARSIQNCIHPTNHRVDQFELKGGSVGDSYDNALAETINGLFKAEVIHRRGPWRSFEAVEYATLEWVDWFNNRRLLEPIGNIPPAEAEVNFYAALETDAMAA